MLINGHEGTPRPSGQDKAFTEQRCFESTKRVRLLAAVFEDVLQFLRIKLDGFGLSRFDLIKGERIAFLFGLETFRHVPAMLLVELHSDLSQSVFVMREIDRCHAFQINVRPNAVGVSPGMFLMEGDGAGLAGETERSLDLFTSCFKNSNRHICICRRVEAQREEILCAFGAQRYRFCFFACADQVLHQEPSHVMNTHVLIVACIQQMHR